jgi:hypothetical protein
MACNLTKGRNLTCRDGIGGIKAIYLVQHDELSSYTAASGELTDLDLGSGDDIHDLTKEDQNEIKLLAQQRMVVFAELNQLSSGGKNKIIAMGLDNGMELSAGTNQSGAALGDMGGYDWTFEGQEPNPMQVVADYTTTPFDNGAFTFNAVVTS